MMTSGHTNAEERIAHSAITELFPVESAPAEVHQNREAEVVIESRSDERVLRASPTSMASGYLLAQHPFTVVSLGTLGDDLFETIDERLDVDLERFDLLQIGRRGPGSDDHCLSEFTHEHEG